MLSPVSTGNGDHFWRA